MVGKLSLIKENFHQIVIPEAVYRELLFLSPTYNLKQILSEDWIKITPITNLQLLNTLSKQLDEGESEAIVLCKEMNVDLLLIDERKGTGIARSLGINTIGLLGVLILSKKREIIPSVRQILDKLTLETTFRISTEIYNKILEQTNEQ